MTYASLFPADVSGIVSLDASPVDRNLYPALNASSQRMIEDALAVGNLTGLSEKEAKMAISRQVADPILQSALLFNLREDGSFSCNLEAIHSNQELIYGFEKTGGSYNGPCLMVNGARSFQREILEHPDFYSDVFPSITERDIVTVEGAGHGLHFEKPNQVRSIIHDFLFTQVCTY